MSQEQNSAEAKAVIQAAVDLLEDADDIGCDGMVTVNNSAYIALQKAVKAATGQDHGIDVEDDEEDDDDHTWEEVGDEDDDDWEDK